MNLSTQETPRKKLEDAKTNLFKVMGQLYEMNYTEYFPDNDSQNFSKNYEIFFFEDYKALIAGVITR